MAEDLFTQAADAPRHSGRAPLPVRMRPQSLDEFVGQAHLLGSGSPLRRLVADARSGAGMGSTVPSSVILYGPPGTGKTTLAYLIARGSDREFVELSAVTAGVRDVRAVIENARRLLGASGRETILFIDEVHRFSKAQQDALLPSVENRWVTLVAATTENPFFAVNSPLLSRSILLTLEPLTEDDVRGLIERAVTDARGLGGEVSLDPQALDNLVRLASGDARKALTMLEAGASAALLLRDGDDTPVLTAEAMAQAVNQAAVRYDRDGDQHYDVASALIKSIRGSDVDAAMHYLARMVVAGEDPRFIARRLVIAASEDIGLADPTALQTAVAAAQAVQFIGMPEGRIILAEAVAHLATAPKSNAAYVAISRAIADVQAGKGTRVPAHLRDGHYAGAKKLGNAQGYLYAHDAPHGVARQQYPPDDLVGVDYYEPTDHGAERAVAERLRVLRRLVRGEQ
ncbi:replication-associated recombination protein A [Micrococcales bacterium 31B]|nr:replication-associated recombination protein A [Micrococcales bacterium 31B]